MDVAAEECTAFFNELFKEMFDAACWESGDTDRHFVRARFEKMKDGYRGNVIPVRTAHRTHTNMCVCEYDKAHDT